MDKSEEMQTMTLSPCLTSLVVRDANLKNLILKPWQLYRNNYSYQYRSGGNEVVKTFTPSEGRMVST